MVNQTEEALGYAAEGKKFADDFGPISNVTFKDVGKFVAEMTPIVGDAMAAKQVYDELQKDEPNYYLAGALGGAALVGLFPGIGDVAANAIRKGAREVFDVAKRVEVDPNAMGSGLGNIKLKPKENSIWSYPKQMYDSAATSINASKNAKGYNTLKERGDIKDGNLIVDIGGGKFNNLVEDAAEQGATVKVYDPFNRTPEHNAEVVDVISNGKADMAMSHNVLNVIKEDKNINNVIKQAENAVKPGGKAHFSVYEGNTADRLKGARETSKGWQRFQTTNEYVPFVESVFGPENVILKDKIITATKAIKKFNKGGVIPMNNQMQQFAEGGLKDEGGEVDEVSGNEVPIGGTKEGVRDDIPANVSEGEFIFPADVVRFIGLDKLMQIRQDAKMGLKKMEAMGQMGNSDEATVDDDMPFEMADLMVVSSDDTPMKFAGGGFIPVEDYTVVQDMIEDRSDKAAAIDKDQAMSDMIADNTNKNATVNKSQEEEVQNFSHGGVAHSNVTLDTAYVPTTDASKVIDYDAYMDSVITEIKEYRNEAGEKINITFINGVAFPPIPVGFTLYVPVDAEAPTEESEIAAVINNNNDDDKGSNRTPSLPPIDYAGMSNEDFAKRMEYENTTGYQVQKNIGLAISAMVPFGLGLAYGSMRSHARASEERLNAMIKGAKTPEEAARLSGIRDGVLKNASLKSTEESTAIAKWVDGWLIGKGYNPNLAAAGANFVNNVNSQGVLSESSVETGTANTAANNAGDLAATQNSFLPKETVQSEEYFEDKLSGNIDDFKKSKTNVIIERLKPGGGKPELAGVNYGVPVNRGEITAVRKYLESLASAEGGAFVGGRETASTKAQERLDKFNTLVESATEAGRTVDNADGFFEGPNNPSYEQVAQDARLFGYNPRTGRQIITVPKKNKNDPQLYFTPNDAANTRSNTMPTNVKSVRDPTDEASRGAYTRFRDLNPTPEAINNFYSTTNTDATYDNPTDSRDIKRNVEASNYYESGAGRDGATSAVLPRTIKSYEAPSSDMSGLDQLAQERFASAQNVPTQSTYKAPEVPAAEETFNQAFNRNRLAGAEVFTHTDGKVYSTKTVEERNAEVASTRPNTGFQDLANLLTKDDGRSYTGGILRNEAGDRVNSAYQNAANALTPGDGKAYKAGVLKNKAGATVNSFYQNAANNLTPNDGRSYVNGVLLDDTTKEPYVEKTKKPSDNIYSVEYGYTGSGVNDVAIGKISDGKTSGVLADKDGKVIRDDNNRTVYVDQSGKQYVKTDLFGMSTQAPTGTIVTQEKSVEKPAPVVKTTAQKVGEDKQEENRQKRNQDKADANAAAVKVKTKKNVIAQQKKNPVYGRAKGGLINRPKAKTKTTNKRGLAARK